MKLTPLEKAMLESRYGIVIPMAVDYLRWIRLTYEDDFIVRMLVAAQQRRGKA